MNSDRDLINSKYVSRYSLEEQGACVKEYLAGASKKELADKWGVTTRTIERWIKKYRRKDNDLEFQMRKRNEKISEEIQRKLMKILNDNAILYGFYISTWNEERVMTLVKNEFGIEITRYIAKQLLDDSKAFGIENEQNVENIVKSEIDCLKEKGYKVFVVDFIKIGTIDKDELEVFTFNKYKKTKVDINLAIARGENEIYVKAIFTECDISEIEVSSREIVRREKMKNSLEFKNKLKNKKKIHDEQEKTKNSLETENKLEDEKQVHDDQEKTKNLLEVKNKLENKKHMLDEKAKFIREILNKEEKNILIITKRDKVVKRFNKRSKNIIFYIVAKDIHEQVFKQKYEKKESLIETIEKNEKLYMPIEKADMFIENIIKSYFEKIQEKVSINIDGVLECLRYS